MSYETVISVEDLAARVGHPEWAVVDCRFSLGDVEKGRRDYVAAHVPGAVYAHLDEDLSSPVIPGTTGRHPLPDVEAIARTLSSWGVDEKVQVVAYDDAGGAIAARLWWILQWLGHHGAAVLDGGWPRWKGCDRPVREGVESRPPRTFTPRPRSERLVQASEVEAIRSDPAWRLVDSREVERFRGEVEPIDPVAGHIPGALNAPHPKVADAEGTFLSRDDLRSHFRSLLGDVPPAHTVFYCGSGVTAARNLLAYAHAGLGDARLYPGSWSEWIADPARPVATGKR